MHAISSWLVVSLFHGSILAALAWALSRTLLRRATPSARALLWAIVLAKFLLPFGPPLPVSLSAAADGAVRAGAAVVLGDGEVLDAPLRANAFPEAVVSLWLAAALLLAAWRLRRVLALRRELSSLPPAPAESEELVRQASRSLGLAPPRVREGRGGPYLAGLLSPTLVLPAGAGGAPLRAMVIHELAHLRRRDPWLRLLQAVAETLFFFWPPVRLAGRALALAREQACDQAVVESAVLAEADYARLLVETRRRAQAAPRTALAMASRVSHLERRIDMLIEKQPLRPARLVLALFAVLGLAGGARAADTGPAAAPGVKQGSLDKNVIAAVIKANLQDVERCYETALATNAKLAGKIVVEWTVESNGKVSGVSAVENTLGDPGAVKCITDRIGGWSFPAPSGGGVVVVHYPFQFATSN